MKKASDNISQEELEKMGHKVHCFKCGKVTMASNKPFKEWLVDMVKAVPCSSCVPPNEYLRSLVNEENF